MNRLLTSVSFVALLSGCAAAPSPPPQTSAPACEPGACLGWSTILLSGGRDAEQNAVAHERNLQFASRTLLARGVSVERVFFADGVDPARDMQQEETDPARRRLLFAAGLLVEPELDLHSAALQERDHEFPGAQPADRASVLRGLSASAAEARARPDRPDLLLYVTDHGIKKADETNNVIVLWGERDLSVRDLGQALDQQPPERRVVSVMAQCFSGSFAALTHQGGDPASPLAEHDRCGFFAAPPDRPAAGCSPRDDEALYDDYTTRFFAALGGLDRRGRPAAPADADADGRVSYDEAHFAAITLERTQDVPVSTSEEFLRNARPGWLDEVSRDRRPLARIVASARPALRLAVGSLLRATASPPDTSLPNLRQRLADAQDGCWPGLCEAEQQLTRAQLEAHRALTRAAGSVVFARQFPALTLATVGAARLQSWIDQAQPHFDEALRLDAQIEALRADAETHEGQLLRLIRLGELQLLEDRARAEGGPPWAAYERIRRCELTGPWPRRR